MLIIQLIVGYYEDDMFQFFCKEINRTPDMANDVGRFGRTYYTIKSIEDLKNKLRNFNKYEIFFELVEITREFKDDEAVYLLYYENVWTMYDSDSDWKSFFKLEENVQIAAIINSKHSCCE